MILLLRILFEKNLNTMNKWLIALKIKVLSGKRLNWLCTKIKFLQVFVLLYITVKSRKLGPVKYVETAFHKMAPLWLIEFLRRYELKRGTVSLLRLCKPRTVCSPSKIKQQVLHHWILSWVSKCKYPKYIRTLDRGCFFIYKSTYCVTAATAHFILF